MRGVKFLAKGFLDSVKPPAKGELFLWSAELPMWGLRVSWTGKASWICQTRVKGKSRRTTLGDARVKSPVQAYKRAKAILDAAEDGRDLMADEAAAEHAEKERKAAATERTIGKLIEHYLADAPTRAKRSHAGVAHYLRIVWRAAHDESAETVDRERLGRVLEAIALERGHVTANRARSQLSTLFGWALTRGWPDPDDPTCRLLLQREANPCRYLHKWDEHERERVLSLEELGAVWRMSEAVSPTFAAIMRLLILSGCRKSEISELRWREIDFDKSQINLPRHRVKNQRPHTIPLASRAVEILRAQPETSSPLTFGSFAWSHVKKRLDEMLAAERASLGLPPMQPWVVHDIRRSVVTWLNEEICPDDPALVELIVNHVGGHKAGVAGVYNKALRLAARRKALEAWAALVQHHAGEATPTADVVPLRRG